MAILYELALLGAPSDKQARDLEEEVRHCVAPFSMALGREVSWNVRPATFDPSQRRASAAVFVGKAGVSDAGLPNLISRGVPIVPVYSRTGRFSAEIPSSLHPFNGIDYAKDGPRRVATALLECAGLLPRQRRVWA